MARGMDRRRFLGVCGAAAGGALLLPAAPARAAYAPIYYDHSAIPNNYGRKEIIRDAMNLLHDRFRDVHVVRNVYNCMRGGAYIAGGVMDRSNFRTSDDNLNNLLWHQIMVLRSATSQGKPWFPKVTFATADYDKQAWAWGRTGLVTVKYETAERSSISGEFKVEVSLRYLGGGGNQSSAQTWASIIAHEMLHYLGHLHELNNYSDNRQINVFARAVWCNGAYKRGVHVPGFV